VIARYADHAANERTFLAWVRTALAVVASGSILARSYPIASKMSGARGLTGDAGIGCVAIGVVLLVSAYRRFWQTRAAIDGDDMNKPRGYVMERVLAMSLAVTGMIVLMTLAGASTT
jgi:putative membrane protein